MFFSLDGVDGVGKSTQINLFCRWLEESGRSVVTCRDPGTTVLSEAIRNLLLSKQHAGMSRRTEMLLYMAARSQLVSEVIRPALQNDKVVVSDRYLLANVAYQGYGGQLDVQSIWELGKLATDNILPHMTFILDMDGDAASRRIQRDKDRMECQGDEFRERVRQGYLSEAERCPDQIVVIDANREIDKIQADIQQAASRIL